jgi:hypothetical protein
MQDTCIRSIMIQLGEPDWTSKALHLACTIARANSCALTFVKMVPVDHPGWLGTELGNRHFSTADRALLRDCSNTAEDYGVPCAVDQFQYVILSDAVLDAAEYFDAHLTFATLPHYRLPLWRNFLMWRLHRQFEARARLFYTLEEPISLDGWTAPASIESPSLSPEKTR